MSSPDAVLESRRLRPDTQNALIARVFCVCGRMQALAQERLEGYRLHVEQARDEIEALQVNVAIVLEGIVFIARRIGRKYTPSLKHDICNSIRQTASDWNSLQAISLDAAR